MEGAFTLTLTLRVYSLKCRRLLASWSAISLYMHGCPPTLVQPCCGNTAVRLVCHH